MNRAIRLALSCCAALAVAACGDDNTTPPGRDSGAGSDSGGPGADGGPIGGDSGPAIDSGMPGDGGGLTPDGGALPAYCPTIAAAGAEPTCPATPTEITVTGDIDTDTTWSCDQLVHLTGPVFVREGTLTIGAGTRVIADNGAALVITQNARIEAVGHPLHPIVFTSSEDEGSRDRGDWGGIVMLGTAPINVSGGSNNIEGLPPTELRGTYGGTDAAHDCGTIRYARIEFAGYVLGEGNELNGLTLGGCGSDTEIEYVQVHRGLDDAFEMFGGTANLRFVVATGFDDDGLDWDEGYVGNIQYAIVHRYADSASSNPNGIEADNLEDNNGATPRSNPTLYNIALIGSDEQAAEIGMVLRRGTYATIRNLIVQGFQTFAANVRDDGSIDAVGTELVITNGIFFDNGAGGTTHFGYGSGDTVVTDTALDDAAAMNRVDIDPGFVSLSTTAPDYTVPPRSAAATGGAAPSGPFFDAQATYVGAIGPGCPDWTDGWTAYPAN
jgi:hypothetical protein